MTNRLKVKFLTVIWGTRYVEEFSRLALPSYLAPGNLPFVARETDLEILIMTSTDSRNKFDEEPIFERLKAICPVRFILIDDLITTGIYGVTLTLAYARGIQHSGPEQTNTNFIFMNSDFVLADGSLTTLVHRLKEGQRCIMAPSLRVCSETTLATLRNAVDQTSGTLTMAPRQMVKLALDNLHPTVVGKTVTQQFITCSTHNQVYWQVDENTLLGRCHLIFMLAIKPEVPLPPVNSYCDYGFVPEMVPSGEFIVLSDSDEFFMLELQSEAQEGFMLHCGCSTQRQIAAELSSWTTREHRKFADIDVVFRSRELPSGLPTARAELAAFVAAVQRRMRKRARKHAGHFYWVSGLQAWASLKYGADATSIELPPELQQHKRNHFVALPGLPRTLFVAMLWQLRRLVGLMPNVPVWNYLWLDSRLILDWVRSVRRRPLGRNLLICDPTSTLPRALQRMVQLEVRIEGALLDRATEARDDVYDNILIHLYRTNVRHTREKLEKAMKLVQPSGTVSVYIQHLNGEFDDTNFSKELAQYVSEVLASNWIGCRVTARFAGGRLRRRLRRMERRVLRYFFPRSLFEVPLLAVTVALWPFVSAATAANNFRLRNMTASCPEYCSSVLLSVTKAPTRRDDAPQAAPMPPTWADARGPALGVGH